MNDNELKVLNVLADSFETKTGVNNPKSIRDVTEEADIATDTECDCIYAMQHRYTVTRSVIRELRRKGFYIFSGTFTVVTKGKALNKRAYFIPTQVDTIERIIDNARKSRRGTDDYIKLAMALEAEIKKKPIKQVVEEQRKKIKVAVKA